MNNISRNTRALVEGALMVAAAEALGYIKLWHMPEGGSVSLMMLPIVLFALRWGLGKGLLAGLALGLLVFAALTEIACTLIGLAGVGHGKKSAAGVALGAALGCLGRFAAVWVTGATLWGEYMYDIYGLPMTNEWVYSFLYNLPTLVAGVLTVIVAVLLRRPMEQLPKVD